MKSETTEAAGKASLDPIVVRGITPKLRRAFNHALGLANESGHKYVGMEHMLLGLLVERESSVRCMLAKLGLDPDRVAFILNAYYDQELRKPITHNVTAHLRAAQGEPK
jgi:ATP-dependent Clp protease ATP-binding subunit ClpC